MMHFAGAVVKRTEIRAKATTKGEKYELRERESGQRTKGCFVTLTTWNFGG